MSDTIVKAIKLPKKLEQYIGKVKGTPANGDRIKLSDLTRALAQRDLNEQDCHKYIEKSRGLDWNLFGHLSVCKMPNGSHQLINGQHRLRVATIINPLLSEFPAHIIDLSHLSQEEAEKEAASHFAKMNGVASRNLNAEQLFWAEVIGQNPEALHIKSVLEKANLQCGKVNDYPAGRKRVKYANFVKCVKMGEDATIYAADLIDRAYPKCGMNDLLLAGMTRLLSHSSYRDLMDPAEKISDEFEDWFVNLVPQLMHITKLGFGQYRNTNRWHDGIAFGLYQMFAYYQRSKGRWHIPLEPIHDVYKRGLKITV